MMRFGLWWMGAWVVLFTIGWLLAAVHGCPLPERPVGLLLPLGAALWATGPLLWASLRE